MVKDKLVRRSIRNLISPLTYVFFSICLLDSFVLIIMTNIKCGNHDSLHNYIDPWKMISQKILRGDLEGISILDPWWKAFVKPGGRSRN